MQRQTRVRDDPAGGGHGGTDLDELAGCEQAFQSAAGSVELWNHVKTYVPGDYDVGGFSIHGIWGRLVASLCG